MRDVLALTAPLAATTFLCLAAALSFHGERAGWANLLQPFQSACRGSPQVAEIVGPAGAASLMSRDGHLRAQRSDALLAAEVEKPDQPSGIPEVAAELASAHREFRVTGSGNQPEPPLDVDLKGRRRKMVISQNRPRQLRLDRRRRATITSLSTPNAPSGPSERTKLPSTRSIRPHAVGWFRPDAYSDDAVGSDLAP